MTARRHWISCIVWSTCEYSCSRMHTQHSSRMHTQHSSRMHTQTYQTARRPSDAAPSQKARGFGCAKHPGDTYTHSRPLLCVRSFDPAERPPCISPSLRARDTLRARDSERDRTREERDLMKREFRCLTKRRKEAFYAFVGGACFKREKERNKTEG